jgi:Phosphatidyl serine synthase
MILHIEHSCHDANIARLNNCIAKFDYGVGNLIGEPICNPCGCAWCRCKALILRDYQLLWVLSIGFELMELTFQHMLPNFNECWWDSWILDVAVCNFLGMWAGIKVHKRIQLRLCPGLAIQRPCA